MQYREHCNAHLNHILDSIYRALNVDNIDGVSAWYACGDDLV